MPSKKWNLVIYTANDDDAKSYSKVSGTQSIVAINVDEAKTQAREFVTKKGYTVRNLSVTTCGKIIAYTGRPREAASVGGWRYKKPPRSQAKI